MDDSLTTPSAHQVLVLKPDNPSNTSLVDSATGEVVYKVITKHESKKATTYVEDAQGKTVASWEWRDVRSDVLTLAGGKPQHASSWLSESKIPFHR